MWLSCAAILLLQASGLYKISMEGDPIGSERFEITGSNRKITSRSSGEISESGAAYKLTTLAEWDGGRPIRYVLELKFGSAEQKYTIDFQSKEALIESGGRSSQRAINISAGAVLLDRNVWHHYRFLIARYDMSAGGAQVFMAFVPQAGLRELPVTVERRGSELLKVGQVRKKVDKFKITLAGVIEIMLLSDESGLPLSIEIPLSKTRVALE
jgi:hypothetical protein